MQEYIIRLIPNDLAQGIINSQLKSVNNYLVYSSSIGGDVVTEFNVKNFLDDASNETIATNFFEFLKQNTSSEEFKSIFYNNQKLSKVFNDFYNKTIRSNEKTNDKVITNQNNSSSALTYSESSFSVDGNRNKKNTSVLVEYNTAQSYYVSVFININKAFVDNSNFDMLKKNTLGDEQSKKISTLLRYVETQNLILPNPLNYSPIEYDSFVGANIGSNGTTAVKFKYDKHIIKQSYNSGLISITVVFEQPIQASGQTFFIIALTSGTTANFGVDFNMNNSVDINKKYRKITPNIGDTGATIDINIFNDFKNEQTNQITIGLTSAVVGESKPGSNNSNNIISLDERKFLIINTQPNINVNKDVEHDVLKENTLKSQQKLLNQFVDLNFDDSESEFWSNESLNTNKTTSKK